MKVTYLFNSGFLVELDRHYLLFDYYRGTLPPLQKDKPLYIFVSHFHQDHYNPQIYDINHPLKTYIIDRKIKNDGFHVHPSKNYTIDDLQIQTLLSNDQGVAFVVHVENHNIYHAGDLHWWHFDDDTTNNNQYMAGTFKKEISKIQDIVFDLMMIPLDPRLQESTTWGMEYILNHVQVKHVMPMHFMLQSHLMLACLNKAPLNKYPNIHKIERKGQVFDL